MYPHAGELDRCMTLQEPVETRDSAGGVTTAWNNVGTFWVQRRDKSGSERFRDGQKMAERKTEIWMRYCNGLDLTELNRLVDTDDGQVYDIAFIDTHRRAGFVRLDCIVKPTLAQNATRGAGQ